MSNQILQHLGIVFEPGDPIWLKLSHNIFYKAVLNDDSSLTVHRTTGKKVERKVDLSRSYDEQWLLQQSREHDGGLFYIPGKPLDFPMKGYSQGSNDIGVELDWGTRDDQEEQYNWFKQITGLDPLTLGSAGKSIHGHLILTENIPIEQRTYLARLLCIVMLGDPAVINEHQPMRLAGGYRKEKGRYQELITVGRKHTLEEILKGLELAFGELGYVFP